MYPEIVSAASCGRFMSRSMAFTEWIRSSLESISVPSKSKINARTEENLASAINLHCNTLSVDSGDLSLLSVMQILTSMMQIPGTSGTAHGHSLRVFSETRAVRVK